MCALIFLVRHGLSYCVGELLRRLHMSIDPMVYGTTTREKSFAQFCRRG
jgi:hypothetical protein